MPHDAAPVQARNGHASPERDDPAETKIGKPIIVTVNRDLATQMRRLKLDVVYHLDADVKDRVDRRRAVLVYRNEGEPFAQQSAAHMSRAYHCESVGTLPLKELGFDGEADSWVDWYDEALGMGRFEDRFDFFHVLEQRANWLLNPSIESIDHDDEFIDPVPDVDGAAFYGPLGQLALETQKETEANALFVLDHLLGFAGVSVGRGPYYVLSGDFHRPNLNIGIVGLSGRARKGTAAGVAKAIWRLVDANFVGENILSGLNSGGGLLHHLRDARVQRGKNGKDVEDPGVADKRRVFLEPELASVLMQGHRDANPLLCYVRQLADGDSKIHSLKTEAITVTDAHVGIIGHCTPADLKDYLTSTDKKNGTAGRFLWHYGVRSKRLLEGGDVGSVLDFLEPDLAKLRNAITTARTFERMRLAPGISDRWKKIYADLDDNHPPGPIGDLFVRAPTYIIRAAMIFALMDAKRLIEVPHLEAAQALWKHSERTLRYLFPADVDVEAERLLAALGAAPAGLSKRQIIHDVFKKNVGVATLDALLLDLLASRSITAKKVHSGRGRPATIYTKHEW
jgi:hypothetical protein